MASVPNSLVQNLCEIGNRESLITSSTLKHAAYSVNICWLEGTEILRTLATTTTGASIVNSVTLRGGLLGSGEHWDVGFNIPAMRIMKTTSILLKILRLREFMIWQAVARGLAYPSYVRLTYLACVESGLVRMWLQTLAGWLPWIMETLSRKNIRKDGFVLFYRLVFMPEKGIQKERLSSA